MANESNSENLRNIAKWNFDLMKDSIYILKLTH